MQPEIQGTIDDLKETKKLFEETISQEAERLSEEEGENVNPEEFDQEKMVYDHVTDITIKTLSNPEVNKAFVTISEKLGKDETLNLINVITLAITNAAAGSIIFYDNLLREKLSGEYGMIINQIHTIKSELEGYYSLSKVLRKKVNDLEKHNEVTEFKKQTEEVEGV